MRSLSRSICSIPLLLLIVAVLLWKRSYYYADSLVFVERISILACRGKVMVFYVGAPEEYYFWKDRILVHDRLNVDHTSRIISMLHQLGQWTTDWNFAGVQLWIGSVLASSGSGAAMHVATARVRAIIIPFWLLSLLLSTPLLVSAKKRHRRRWRLRHGLCVACGFDLRASSDRCPECGGVIQSSG